MSAIPLRRIEGKYEILEKLGEGGMGAVYKVRHRLLDDVRVIKMMRPQLVADEEFKARFQREARVAIQLRHPNVAHLIDFTIDEDDGTAFIVMEFIDGMTLEEMLRHQGPPPLGLAVEIAQQSLRALACLHEKGFVHRDISPDNLMLTEDVEGQPLIKLIDLGIAKVLGAGVDTGRGLTGTGIFLGKVRYSPPEQFGTEGAATVDARGDLYSFGVVLYELLTGKYPIQGRDPSSLIAGHLFRPPLDFAESDPLGRIPPELRAVALKALAKEPAHRFASARDLLAALAAFRSPGDVAEGDLKRALTKLPSGTLRVPLPPRGSTQDRLDLQFGLRSTPSHDRDGGKTEVPRRGRELELRIQTLLREAEALLGSESFEEALAHLERGRAFAQGNAEALALLDKAEAAARERWQSYKMDQAEAEIEAALARSDYRGAERRLYAAEASFGEREVFLRLHDRLAELRRRDLEARRRAERLAAAVREIEEEIVKGARERAQRLLDETGAAFGEEPALAALRGRLEALRREARQAEAAALVASAARHQEEDDLPAALAEARRALDVDPDNERARALADAVALEIARREEDARRLAREAETAAEIAALLAAARERRAADDLDGALQELRKVFALEGESAAARALVGEIEAERRRREDEAERAARLAAARAGIAGRLDAGDLVAAGALLEEAAAAFGDLEPLQALRGRLEDLRREAHEREIAAKIAALLAKARERRAADDLEGALQQARQVLALDGDSAAARTLVEEIEAERRRCEEVARREAREREIAAEIAALLARARTLRAADDLDGALQEARRVLALDTGSAAARDLIEEIAAERRRREKETQRAEQLAAAVASIDVCLDREDPESAARLLPGIVAIFGDEPALRERWERIEELRRRKTRERAAFLLGQARKLQGGGELEAALGALREARGLLPDDQEVRTLVQEIEDAIRRRDEESLRERELETALAAIDEEMEEGDLTGAARLLPAAVARFGGAPALRERWERLEALQRKARVEALRGEAATLAQAGHVERAVRKLRQALELDPGNRGILDRLAELSRR